MAKPSDTSELEALFDRGVVDPATVVALVGKTEGTGLHDDFGRELADLRLREALAQRLGITREEVADRVTLILSGGCFGVISPHVSVLTQGWVEAGGGRGIEGQGLVVGRALSEPILGEDVGRLAQIDKVAAAVSLALADAGISDPSDVHSVMVKAPSLSRA